MDTLDIDVLVSINGLTEQIADNNQKLDKILAQQKTIITALPDIRIAVTDERVRAKMQSNKESLHKSLDSIDKFRKKENG